MSFDTNWDVDKYRNEHEPTHHWQLRRLFMVNNQDSIPEQRLVCLAQTFANIEFLGCKYPDATMKMISELSYGIGDAYREAQEKRIKRTFVSGSDAAGAKHSKMRKIPTNVANQKYGMFVPATGSEKQSMPKLESISVKQAHINNTKVFNLNSDNSAPSPNFLLIMSNFSEHAENPLQVLQKSASFCGVSCDIIINTEDNGMTTCKCLINNKEVGRGTENKRKNAIKFASKEAVDQLSRKCYILKLKTRISTEKNQINMDQVSPDQSENTQDFDVESLGYKMLRVMGWNGTGGLGRDGRGISEPITTKSIYNREGLGSENTQQFRRKVKTILQEYLLNTDANDNGLAFSSDMSNAQRKQIHIMANSLGLKSKSYGTKADRMLTISRRRDVKELLEELIAKGGISDKYELIPPSSFDQLCGQI